MFVLATSVTPVQNGVWAYSRPKGESPTWAGKAKQYFNTTTQASKEAALVGAGLMKAIAGAAAAFGGASLSTFIKDNTSLDILGKALMFALGPALVIWGAFDMFNLKKEVKKGIQDNFGTPIDVAQIDESISRGAIEANKTVQHESMILGDLNKNTPTNIKSLFDAYSKVFDIPDVMGALRVSATREPDKEYMVRGVSAEQIPLSKLRQQYSMLVGELVQRRDATNSLSDELNSLLPKEGIDPSKPLSQKFTNEFLAVYNAARTYESLLKEENSINDKFTKDLKERSVATLKGFDSAADIDQTAAIGYLSDISTRMNALSTLDAAIQKINVDIASVKTEAERVEIATIRAALIAGFRLHGNTQKIKADAIRLRAGSTPPPAKGIKAKLDELRAIEKDALSACKSTNQIRKDEADVCGATVWNCSLAA